MKTLTKFMAIASTACLMTSNAMALTPEAKNEIGRAAVDYMKENPSAFTEIVTAVQAHAQNQAKQRQRDLVQKYQSDLFEKTEGAPIVGNAQGTTEIVLFMDPFCHFCRKFEETIRTAVKDNTNIKFIARDIAIMHPKSSLLITALIAANNQGKYMDMQSKVHKVTPEVTQADLMTMAKEIGLNMDQFKKDMESEATMRLLKSNMDLADKLDVAATPTFVIKGKDTMNAGYVSYEDLKAILQG